MSAGEPRHLVLIGMMGAGKSSVGRRLATRLGRPFVDTDRAVEERAGRSIPDIFADDGEPAFRRLEASAVSEALRSATPAVVAVGGGAVLDPATRALARETALVVWLQAPVRELARRVSASLAAPARPAAPAPGGKAKPGPVGRPLLRTGERPDVTLEAIARDREELYRTTAHVTVDTAGMTAGQVVTAVLHATGWEEVAR